MPFDVWTCFVGTRLMDRLRTSSHAVESHILWGQGQCEGGLFPPWETVKPPNIHATKQPLQSSLWFPTPPASSGHSDHPSNPPQQKLTTIKVPQSTTTLQSQTWDASSAWSPTGTSWIKGTNLKHRSKKVAVCETFTTNTFPLIDDYSMLVYRHVGKKCVEALQLHQTAPLVGKHPTRKYGIHPSANSNLQPKSRFQTLLQGSHAFYPGSCFYHQDALQSHVPPGCAWKHWSWQSLETCFPGRWLSWWQYAGASP